METNTSVNYRNFNISEIVSQAWELTKKHFPIFLLGIILASLISYLPGSFYNAGSFFNIILMEEGGTVQDTHIGLLLIWLGITLLLYFVCVFLAYYVSNALYRMLYHTIHGEKPDLTAALKGAKKGYWPFVGTYIVWALGISLGICFCILPGIYLSVRWMFVPYIKSVHPEKSLSECFSQSWEMTKDHFWDLFLLGIVALLIYCAGFLVCCVGVLFTSIIGFFIFGLAYEQLAPSNPEEVALEEAAAPASEKEETIVTES